jgi:hypothetical protein
LTGRGDMRQAAVFFRQTVIGKRTVAERALYNHILGSQRADTGSRHFTIELRSAIRAGWRQASSLCA